MGTMSLGSGWATCPGHELARHLLVVSSLDDGKLSPGGLEAPGCCAIAAQEGCQQISGIKRAPCEVLVSLPPGGLRVSAVELLSNAGVCEVCTQPDGDPEPSYLATVRGQKEDTSHVQDALCDVPLLRSTLQVNPSASLQAIRLRLLSLRGDKSRLHLAFIALCVDTSSPAPSQSAPDAKQLSSQMGEVRSYLGSILGPGSAPQRSHEVPGEPPCSEATGPPGSSHCQVGNSGIGYLPNIGSGGSAKGLLGALAKAALASAPAACPVSAAQQTSAASPAAHGVAAPGSLLVDCSVLQGRLQRIEEACCRLESRDVATAGRLEGEAAGGKAPLLCCASAHQELGERMSRLEEAVGSIDKKLDRVLGLLMSRVN